VAAVFLLFSDEPFAQLGSDDAGEGLQVDGSHREASQESILRNSVSAENFPAILFPALMDQGPML
jgi:hypothetical protein